MTNTFDWRLRSRCRSLSLSEIDELFFPNKGRSINKTKEFCNNCPVVSECLKFALETQAKGIWAGTSYIDRVRITNRLSFSTSPTKKKKTKKKNFVFS